MRNPRLPTALLALALVACNDDGGGNPPISTAAQEFDSAVAGTWFDLIYRSVRDERMSPPVAARTYGYHAVALYEAVVPGMSGHRSLGGQLNGLGALPETDPDLEYDWPTVANAALATVGRTLFAADTADTLDKIDELEQQWLDSRGFAIPEDVIQRSMDHGQALGAAILAWAATDGYTTYNNCAFTPPVGPGLWVPTPPANLAPLQPCWGQLRPFVLTSGDELEPPAPPPYSEDPASAFYAEALEVYNTDLGLTQEQTDIANYWADGPTVTGTPPGHWIRIVANLCADNEESLDVAAEAFARVGIAMHDSFIACWSCKYVFNLLRPVTYIQAQIDDEWLSSITTPNFPEYTSGHSTQSGAASLVLTDLFGPMPFTDRTHDDRGFARRSFANFEDAALEAAISRLYGGIHYRSAIDIGVDHGEDIGRAVLQRIDFRR
jgi:hypothetical protein